MDSDELKTQADAWHKRAIAWIVSHPKTTLVVVGVLVALVFLT